MPDSVRILPFPDRSGDGFLRAAPASGRPRGRKVSSPATNSPGSGMRSTPASASASKPSPRSACWRSPDAAATKCSICAGEISERTPSTFAIRRRARVRCRSAKPHGLTSVRYPDPATRTCSCLRATPGVRARKPRELLAHGLCGRRTRQAPPARPAPHRREPGRHGKREPAL